MKPIILSSQLYRQHQPEAVVFCSIPIEFERTPIQIHARPKMSRTDVNSLIPQHIENYRTHSPLFHRLTPTDMPSEGIITSEISRFLRNFAVCKYKKDSDVCRNAYDT
jgi:hypothetical protein